MVYAYGNMNSVLKRMVLKLDCLQPTGRVSHSLMEKILLYRGNMQKYIIYGPHLGETNTALYSAMHISVQHIWLRETQNNVLGDLTGCQAGNGGKLRCSQAEPD